MQEQDLEEVSTFRYLGVTIDNNLTFKEHYDCVYKKAKKKFGYFSRIAKNLNRASRLLVYNSTISRHYQYCCTALSLLNKGQINSLQLRQNKGLRIITFFFNS